ncbi:MAG TPA: hypothetical protein VKU85_13925 [bacterium]|nr:hypothetical protein [bacterium]
MTQIEPTAALLSSRVLAPATASPQSPDASGHDRVDGEPTDPDRHGTPSPTDHTGATTISVYV